MIYTTTTGGPSALLVENVFAIPEEQGVSLRGKVCDSDHTRPPMKYFCRKSLAIEQQIFLRVFR